MIRSYRFEPTGVADYVTCHRYIGDEYQGPMVFRACNPPVRACFTDEEWDEWEVAAQLAAENTS